MTTYSVDPNGNTIAVTRPTVTQPSTQAITETLTYDGQGRCTSATDGSGRSVSLTYYTGGPQHGWLASITRDPSGLALTTSFSYDAFGNLTSVTDPMGNTTSIDVDSEGYVTKITRPSPFLFETKFSYDINRNLIQTQVQNKDKDGVLDATTPWITTTYAYDLIGRPLSVTRPLAVGVSATTSYVYEASGLIESITNGEGEVTRFEYDERHLPYKITRGYGTADASTTQIDYDENGRRSRFVDGRGNATTYDHDLHGRLSKITDALGHYRTWAYDKNSNVTSIQAFSLSSTLLQQTDFSYDEIDRMWQRKAHRFGPGIPTTYPTTTITRDLGHRISSVSDPLSNATTRTYDGAGRLGFGHRCNGEQGRVPPRRQRECDRVQVHGTACLRPGGDAGHQVHLRQPQPADENR